MGEIFIFLKDSSYLTLILLLTSILNLEIE